MLCVGCWMLSFFVFLRLSFCFALFEVELSSFDGSVSWVITDTCFMERESEHYRK